MTKHGTRGRAVLAALLSLAPLVALPASGGSARPLLIIRPVQVPADTWPGRTSGTFGFRVYNRSSHTLRLSSVRQTGHAPCGVHLRARRLHVRLRSHRWTVVRLRRAVSMRRDSPNGCQGRTLTLKIRVAVSG